jgi:hypothetical protein
MLLEYMSTLCLLLEGMASSQSSALQQVQDAVIRLDTITGYSSPSEAVRLHDACRGVFELLADHDSCLSDVVTGLQLENRSQNAAMAEDELRVAKTVQSIWEAIQEQLGSQGQSMFDGIEGAVRRQLATLVDASAGARNGCAHACAALPRQPEGWYCKAGVLPSRASTLHAMRRRPALQATVRVCHVGDSRISRPGCSTK